MTINSKPAKNKIVYFSLEVLQVTQSETQTLVFSHIAHFNATFGQFKSQVSAIAKHLNYSVNAVKKAIDDLIKKDMIIQDKAEKGYKRTITINPAHDVAFSHLVAHQAMKKKLKGNYFNLYAVDFKGFTSKSRHDSRHEHKALMLNAVIATKIRSNFINSKNKNKSYRQTISDICTKTNWAFMTVKRLMATMLKSKAIDYAKDTAKRAVRYVFSLPSKIKIKRSKPQPVSPGNASKNQRGKTRSFAEIMSQNQATT